MAAPSFAEGECHTAATGPHAGTLQSQNGQKGRTWELDSSSLLASDCSRCRSTMPPRAGRAAPPVPAASATSPVEGPCELRSAARMAEAAACASSTS